MDSWFGFVSRASTSSGGENGGGTAISSLPQAEAETEGQSDKTKEVLLSGAPLRCAHAFDREEKRNGPFYVNLNRTTEKSMP